MIIPNKVINCVKTDQSVSIQYDFPLDNTVKAVCDNLTRITKLIPLSAYQLLDLFD
jgi:hypothetical protein